MRGRNSGDISPLLMSFFPDIQDKLLNTIQLAKLSDQTNTLLQASIAQKAAELRLFEFPKAVNSDEYKPFFSYLLLTKTNIFIKITLRKITLSRFFRSQLKAKLTPWLFLFLE